ncbi:hypothetical protein ACFL1H_02790 [Nanoarchaeota archaeon]
MSDITDFLFGTRNQLERAKDSLIVKGAYLAEMGILAYDCVDGDTFIGLHLLAIDGATRLLNYGISKIIYKDKDSGMVEQPGVLGSIKSWIPFL